MEKFCIISKQIINQTKRVGIFPLLSFERKEKLTNIESKIENLLLSIIEKLEYELYDVEYVKEGKDYFLRIYIDSPKGISLDDCEKVNNEITDVLDEFDYIKEQYFLYKRLNEIL